MGQALVIIDVQKDYFPNGRCELFEANEALTVIVKLLQHFREIGAPVYFVQHISDKDSTFFIPDTDGVQIHPEIMPLHTEKVIVKHTPNSFYNTTLEAELKSINVKELVVCGMMTHMCVDTTVRAARDLDFNITLISDACATKELKWSGQKVPASVVQTVYMASLNGRFAKVETSADYLASIYS